MREAKSVFGRATAHRMLYTWRRKTATQRRGVQRTRRKFSMRVRSITTCALGLAAALTVVSSSLAAQSQDTTKLRRTTTSLQRIPISKDSPGEVVTVRVDTIYVTRHDTVTNTILRIDTVTVTPPPPVVIPTIKGPFYWAVFGGSTWPWGNIDRVYTNGFHAGGAIGLESQTSPIGFRLDGTVSQLGKEQGSWNAINQGSGTSLMMHLAADLKAKALMFRGWSFYGVAGLQGNRYKQIALASEGNTLGGDCEFLVRGDCYKNADTGWKMKFGWNAGLGVDFHIGSQDMFLEGRYVAVQAGGARSFYIPMSIGVRYF
jgi:opacity protein-like surface antigen